MTRRFVHLSAYLFISSTPKSNNTKGMKLLIILSTFVKKTFTRIQEEMACNKLSIINEIYHIA